MPIYEYLCKFCKAKVEQLQKVSDSPLENCPKCLQDGLKKLVSAANITFKGTGWYKTDYATKPLPRENQSSTPVGTDQAAKADKPSDAADIAQSSANADTSDETSKS